MKKGLTISEMLITLMIVGTIAILTIPGIYTNVSEATRITALHKLYTALNTDIKTVLAEAGSSAYDSSSAAVCDTLSCLRAWGNETTSSATSSADPGVHNGILANEDFLEIRDMCKSKLTENDKENGIKTCDELKYLEDGVLPFGAEEAEREDINFSAYILEDGTELGIFDFAGNCMQTGYVKDSCKSVKKDDNTKNCTSTDKDEDCELQCDEDIPICAIILVDVNGEKSPNKPGEDRFGFFLADEKIGESYLVPIGFSEDDKDKDDDDDDDDNLYNKDGEMFSELSGDKDGYNKTAKIMVNGWKPVK